MTLLSPLALAFALIAVPLVLLYILKLRRPRHVVGSTLLWRQAVEDVQANMPWQRLRPTLLLLLQLLALAALVLALARPAYTQTRAYNGDIILIVDESFGMQARDVAPSRFVVALQQAHQLAGDLGAGKVMSVIGMGAEPHLAIAESGDQGAIDQAISSLRAGVAAPNFLRSLSLAAALARAGTSTRVVVLTSRDSGIASLPIDVPFNVELVRIGGRLHDLGISTFQATRAGKLVQALARVSNFGTGKASSDLDLYVDGRLADVQPAAVAGGGEQNFFWSSLPAGSSHLEVRLTTPDDVSGDKTAWAVIAPSRTLHVLLVSRGDFFLESALGLDPSIAATEVGPAAYRAPAPGRYDLVIFDGWLPPHLPDASVFILGPPAGTVLAPALGGTLRFGALQPVATLLPATGAGPAPALLQYVDLGDVHIAGSRAMRLPDWTLPVVTAGGRAVIAAGEDSGIRLAVFGFDVQRSDWPLRVSFPVLVRNIVQYLSPGLGLGATSLAAGSPLKLFVPPGTRAVDVLRPDGSRDQLGPPFGLYTGTALPGIYSVVDSRPGLPPITAGFAVNFSPARSAPVEGPATQWLGHAAGGGANTSSAVPVSLTWALCLLALGVLSAEWWVAFRR